MLKIYLIIIVCGLFISMEISGQEKKKSNTTNIVVIDEDGHETKVTIPGAKIEVNELNDTVAKITIGRHTWQFIEDGNKAQIRIVKANRDYFKGHWAGVQLGFCNYEVDNGVNFMDINSGESMSFGINFLQYNIGLQKYKTNLGLVTGMGWMVYNYRQDNNFIITKNPDGITYGEPITDREVTKSKIVTSYINIPLLLEIQSAESSRTNAFISAGVFGGFRLGSHTKTVYYGGDKKKSREDININPFQYGVMVQAGIEFIKLYGTYNFSTLYEKNKGPEVTPYTVGLTLLNF